MTHPLIRKRANIQAEYMDALAKKARTIAEQNSDKLSFDPQGRVLVDVTLNDKESAELITIINQTGDTQFTTDKKGLELALKTMGIPCTSTTVVSLDVSNEDQTGVLFKQYFKKLNNALTEVEVLEPHKIINQLKQIPKGSIIALQQEFHFHLSLASRLYQAAAPEKLTAPKMAIVHAATMARVSKLVMIAYAKALKEAAHDESPLDLAKLNKALDKARKEILPQAHTIMMEEIVRHTGVILSKEELKKVTLAQGEEPVSLKHAAEATTATPNDVLHLDSKQGLATLIAGSENTAHKRKAGKEFAHRQISTHNINYFGEISANENPRIQIRTPSPVLKEGLNNDQEYINDVAIKLTQVIEEYQLATHLTGDTSGRKPKAFIYNSYTAINDTLGDINGNLQTQSADHILRGAHRQNYRQLRDSEDPVFCFVQNISVNGFGNTLGYNSGNSLKEETTLMAELALLHTLYDSASETDKEKIGAVFKKYKDYLTTPPRPSYFSSSKAGKDAINLIQEIKTQWQNTPVEDTKNIQQNVKLGLKNLMAHDLHYSHEYSKLIQSLSVYSEEASISGCKSGNERAQAINGRVQILDSLQSLEPTAEQLSIKVAIARLASGKNVADAAKSLKEALDTEYNRVGLQAGASIISLVDQGGPAKVDAKQGRIWWWTSRNFAEELSSVLSNLFQSKASSMQAHKDLTKQMISAWQGHSKDFWQSMKSSPLGTAGAILAIFPFFPIGIVVGIAGYFDKKQRKAATLATNEQLKEEYIKNHPEEIVNEAQDSPSKIKKLLSKEESRPPMSLANSMQSTVPTLKTTYEEQPLVMVDNVEEEPSHESTNTP